MARMNEQLAKWDSIIEEKARQYGLPPALVRSVIWQESRGNPNATSPVGARGLMQLMPGTAKELGVDPSDPVQNIDGGVRYLKKQIDRFGLEEGVAAYNAGPGNVINGKWKGFKETQGYVKNVLGNFGDYPMGASAGAAMPGAVPEAPWNTLREPLNNLRHALGMPPMDANRPEDTRTIKFDPLGNPNSPETPWYLQAVDKTKSAAEDVYGFGRTLFKGANQGSAKILDTTARTLRDFTPFGAPNTALAMKEALGFKVDPESPEAKFAALTRKINPGTYLANWTGRMNEGAQAEPPTRFEQKYPNPLLKVGGTTIVPSPGELARGTGEFLPEMAFSASLPAQSVAAQVGQRFGPAVRPAMQRATAAAFGGLAGGTAKGEPEQAAINTVLFPAFGLAAEGAGYYAKQAPRIAREMGKGFRETLADQSGAVPIGRRMPPPTPETAETLAIQMEALAGGRSKAVLVTPGSPMPRVPRGFQKVETEVGTWIVDPRKLKPYQIKSDVMKGDYGKYLGHLEPKSLETTQVVAANQGGIEAKTSLASPEAAPAQAKILQKQFPKADVTVGGLETAAPIIRARMPDQPQVGRAQGGADVIPLRPPGGAGGTPPLEPPPGPPLDKARGFTQTVRESQMSPPELAEGVSGTYQVKPNQQTMDFAQKAVQADAVKARETVLGSREMTAETNAMGIELIRKYKVEGDFPSAIRIADHLSEQATKQGQAIQSLSIYNRLGPDGILQLAQRTVKQARNAMPKAKIIRLDRETQRVAETMKAAGENVDVNTIRETLAKKLKIPTVTPEFAQQITQRATQIEAMAEGYEKTMATAEMLRDIGNLVPSSVLRKIATFQTIAQLFNPKTMMRNVVGNTMFTVGENVKDLVASPLDRAVSIVTGQRTKSLAGGNQILEQARGFKEGLIQGAKEAWRGIDTSRVADKWEINQIQRGHLQGSTFRGKIMGNIERTLGVALRAPDRAFYQAAVKKSMAEQMSIAGAAKPSEEMIAQAHFEGLYKTFQDDSAAARVFGGLKKAMNLGREFGAGDILIKYPKTPGNILTRSLEYSPAGFVKSLFEVGKAAFGHGFDQKAFVDATSRAIVGSAGVTGLGYGLSNIGLLRNTAPRDPDLRAVEATEGRTQSQLNVSGLRRYLMSGFEKKAAAWKPEDTLVTYDWAVPLSTSLSFGARAQEKGLDETVKVGQQLDNFAVAAAGFEGALESLGEQPMIKTFTNLARGQTLPKSLIQAAKGIPASFTPTLLKQVAQLTDNKRRDTFDPNPVLMAMNLAVGKTPGARELPAKIDPFGREMENYQGGTNSVLNVMLNPSFMSKYRPTPESKMVVDLYHNTNDAKVVPIVVESKFKFNGVPYEMNARQRNNMQKWVGQRTQKFFATLANNPQFMGAPDEVKVDRLSSYLTKVRSAARAGLFLDDINQKSTWQKPAYIVQLFQKHKLSPEQIEGVIRDIAMFRMMNK